ncbi:PSD1 and planctomycete cytochrome C domain-containing protein [Gimesia sp.]|uniref:PSD1 and planctomycete cytochrome C domain-containing protein n=1 Tax=Gimesia sp. TaxID=2024833 RepID=UPI003A8FE073
MMLIRTIIPLLVVVFVPGLARTIHAAEKPLQFEADIQPVLAAKCGKCHSDKVRKGGLDLSTIAGVHRGGESGESAIAEKVDDSMLWILIDGGDMPPEGQPQLTDAERTLIHTWLATGAKSAQPHQPEEKQITQHDVLPIVLLRCTACHGARLQRGGLDMRTPASMLKGGKQGPAFIAGKPDESRMIKRIESHACPPQEQLLKFFVKRPPQSEVDTLREWIATNAPIVDPEPEVVGLQPDPLVTAEDRQHWAFQPPQKQPEIKSIDQLILKELQAHKLEFSPEASRDTLIRRVYLDLTGIPPTLAEWKQWRNSEDPDWYAQMVDHLLASPRYGERWGRYWLDLAGYADSEGGVSSDPLRAVAWKYRDYVIDAFNKDKPYDRFLLEQIAGDELTDYENAPVITEEMVENLVATGFLRMGIDQTGSRTMNFVPERLGVVYDAINVMGSSVMGLTLECARCHSHKYDPLPHRDYYRFKAIFQGALDEYDWLSFKNRSLELGTPEQKSRVKQTNPLLKKELTQLEKQHKKAIAAQQIAMLRQFYPDQPAEEQQETLQALKIADNTRTQRQRILVEKLRIAETMPESDFSDEVQQALQNVSSVEKQMSEVQQQMEPPLTIRALWDRGEPSPTYILLRGEHDQPGHQVGPGVPSVLTDGRTPFTVKPPFPEGTPKTGRRLALAQWLTQDNHPLTARVMVNRIWYHHFGTGLVKSLENFGVKGERPSHPELLDWLAVQFMEQDWSIKEMHRLMLNSRTYKQTSHISPEIQEHDPQNRLLSHMPLRRMNAEALRDSILSVSGKLDPTPGGPPDSVTVDRDGLVSANMTGKGGWRRSVYLQYRRTQIPTMLDTFDYPEMGPNCVSRTVSTVSPQSLMLLNNERVHTLSHAFASRVRDLLPDDQKQNQGAQVDLVYQLALSRSPSKQERQLGQATLQELEALWKENPEAALDTYCHTILNSAAFLYID